MAGSMNRATLIGNLGKDPEVRSTQNGTRIASFSVATSESWRDKQSGERKERTQWHAIIIFNEPLVDIAEKYLRKGSKVMVEGQIENRKWQDQSGQDRYTTEIVLRPYQGTILLLGDANGGGRDDRDHGRGNGNGARGQSGQQSRGNGQRGDTNGYTGNYQRGGGGPNDLDDSIPFAPIRELP